MTPGEDLKLSKAEVRDCKGERTIDMGFWRWIQCTMMELPSSNPSAFVSAVCRLMYSEHR